MKKLLLLTLVSLVTITCFAQSKTPATFSYEAKKKAADVYEIIITATIKKPWHLYSQGTDKGGPIPTKITFKANPLVKFTGKVVEKGKLEKIFDKTFGVNVLYFSNSVQFVQTVKIKPGIKTNIGGVIEFMVCDDKECLPPKKQSFEVKLS